MCIESRAESFEGLMDLISEVPLLLEESEILLTSAKSTFSLRESTLLQSLLCVFQKLDTWQQRCRLSFAKPPYWAVPSKLHNPSDDAFTDKLFPFALEFESLNVAMPLVLNSGVMLQVLGTVLLLDAKIGSFNDQPMARDTVESRKRNPLDGQKTVTLASGTIGQKYASVSSIKAEADRLARFLCQSIEYCHRIEMGTLGPQATCHPQWAMRRYFRQARLERELEWCKNIKNMSGPGSRCGIELMLFGADESTL
jgi:hypothetical protein